jgi:hypothetical protein
MTSPTRRLLIAEPVSPERDLADLAIVLVLELAVDGGDVGCWTSSTNDALLTLAEACDGCPAALAAAAILLDPALDAGAARLLADAALYAAFRGD